MVMDQGLSTQRCLHNAEPCKVLERSKNIIRNNRYDSVALENIEMKFDFSIPKVCLPCWVTIVSQVGKGLEHNTTCITTNLQKRLSWDYDRRVKNLLTILGGCWLQTVNMVTIIWVDLGAAVAQGETHATTDLMEAAVWEHRRSPAKYRKESRS